MKSNNVTFIYKSGRKSRLSSNQEFPKEFFYGYHQFLKNFKNVNLIEYNEKVNVIFKFIFKVIRKLSGLPIYSEKLLSIKNLKLLIKTDYLILTNQNIGYSMMFLSRFLKLFRKINTTVFIMGVLDISQNKSSKKKLFNKYLFSKNDNIIFLSHNEKKFAEKLYPKYCDKFYFLPFPVDLSFWNTKNTVAESGKILFLGNDLNRNYDLLKLIPQQIPEEQFVYITERISPREVSQVNLELINGSWNDSTLSDLQIKEIYANAKLVILPLHNSIQPSGQSVAIQAMSMNIPVLISKTDGFWDSDKFINEENIIFIDSKDSDVWVKTIEKILKDFSLRKKISEEAKKIVNKEYDLETFYRNLLKILIN